MKFITQKCDAYIKWIHREKNNLEFAVQAIHWIYCQWRRSGVFIAYAGHISHYCSTVDFEEVYGKRQTSVFPRNKLIK